MRKIFMGLGILCIALAMLSCLIDDMSIAATPERGKVCVEISPEKTDKEVKCQNNACSPTSVFVEPWIGKCETAPFAKLCDSFCETIEVPAWTQTRYEAAWTVAGNFYWWADTGVSLGCNASTIYSAGKVVIIVSTGGTGAGAVIVTEIVTSVLCWLGQTILFPNDYCKDGYVSCQKKENASTSSIKKQSCK